MTTSSASTSLSWTIDFSNNGAFWTVLAGTLVVSGNEGCFAQGPLDTGGIEWPSTSPSPIALVQGASYTLAYTARLSWPGRDDAGFSNNIQAQVRPQTNTSGYPVDFQTSADAVTDLPVHYSYTFTETRQGGDPAAAIEFAFESYGGSVCISNVSFTAN
jgi:hypothetical protein